MKVLYYFTKWPGKFLYSSIKYVAASRMKTPLKYSCRGSNTTTEICKSTVTNSTDK
jgi:hypothetical protein